jgi:membrane-associated phospholipid phosphatase
MQKKWLKYGLGLMAAAVLAGVPTAADAQTPPRRLVFDQDYRPFQWPDAAQTGVTLGAYAYLEFGVDYPAQGRWHEPILFDAAARNALLAPSRSGRRTAALVSDVTWYVPMALPWVEALALPLFTDHFNYEVAFQLTALNTQAISVVALLTRAGHKLVARERPDVEPCTKDPTYDDTCFAGSYAGFPSGHVSAALVGAGLSCAHHAYLRLIDGGIADTVVCVSATALGVVNGVARVSADRHYMTDVIAGAVLGWGAGFAMPVLLHYEWGAAAPRRAWAVSPWATSSTVGLAALGLW